MQKADTILGLIRERGRKGLPLERVHRLLYNPELYLMAYGKIYRNKGAMTKGVTEETADSMSQAKIKATIEQLRNGTFQWTPVRRTYIAKKNGKMRPLGMPTWMDKIVQEVIRMILEAYYEPQFSTHSHGFRPERGCHTALREIYYKWPGTIWFIEADISQCFDKLDHHILLTILREDIHDEQFLTIIGKLLKAGYLEGWKYNRTQSGTPQGGIASPILANIYLSRLDKYVEQQLIPAHTRGKERKPNPVYTKLMWKAHHARKVGNPEEAQRLKKQAQQIPSLNTSDPQFRRLRYVRYADDFLLGFSGPKSEAEEVKRQLGEYMRDTLKLELSQTKTVITNAKTEVARFLGYEIHILSDDTQRTKKRRSLNGQIGFHVPKEVIEGKCRKYMKAGKPVQRNELLLESDYSILETYQTEYRGLVEYYRLAYNLAAALRRLKQIMEKSLIKTLAFKLRITGKQVYERYKALIEKDGKSYKGLRVTRNREGKEPLITEWGGISLKWDIQATLNDHPKRIWNGRTELVQRLLADTCEWCGVTSDTDEVIQVHHIRGMRHLKKYDGREKPEWVKLMIARQRKTMVVCRTCHEDIEHGHPMKRPSAQKGFMYKTSKGTTKVKITNE